jgi:hypothetical protein
MENVLASPINLNLPNLRKIQRKFRKIPLFQSNFGKSLAWLDQFGTP